MRKYNILKRQQKGITLIALVITIIVLLILATVAISTLTGENGILKKVDNAKTTTIVEEEKEQIKLAYNAILADKMENGNKEAIKAEELKTELKKQNPDVVVADKEGETNKIEVTFDKSKNKYIVDGKTGEITGPVSGGENPESPWNTGKTVEEAKEQNKPYENKTIIKDDFGNKITVPEGFKIGQESATDVTGGVVIEDVTTNEDGTPTDTNGSEFVWIPVGTVYTNEEQSQSKIITVGRYVFKEDGTIDATLSKTEPNDQLKTNSNYYFIEGVKDSITSNEHAKDIVLFRNSVSGNGGYYIGRYEARVKNRRTDKTDSDIELEKVNVKKEDYVYNNITQSQAAKLAREMYQEDKTFTSDLVNSYAWDIAIEFLQEFDNRTTDKTKPYSRQSSLNTEEDGLAEKGTNHLIDLSKQDKICNIWDMASNSYEWTTETYSYPDLPCVIRGGSYYNSSKYASDRNRINTTDAYDIYSFRVILYM